MTTKTINDYDEITEIDDEDYWIVWEKASGKTRKIAKKYLHNGTDKVGMGIVSPPAAQLHVYRATGLVINMMESGDDGASVMLKAALNKDAYVRFFENNVSKAVIGVDGSDSDKLKIATGLYVDPSSFPVVAITIDASNNVTIGGGLTMSTGKNVTLSGTADIYTAQGSYTPVLGGTTSDPSSVTYYARQGYYKRIGNIVFFYMYMHITAKTGGDGLATFSLPVATGGTYNAISVGTYSTSTSDDAVAIGRAYTSDTTMYLTFPGNDVVSPAISSMPNEFSLHMSGHYFV